MPEVLSDLAGRLVIQWASPRAWWVNGTTAQKYPVLEVVEAEPEPFPGFDHLVVDFDRLQAVVSDPRYAAWRTALSSVIGIYLITDLSDGRQYVGKADGNDTLLQRWTAYAANGHGGNVELKKRERPTPDSPSCASSTPHRWRRRERRREPLQDCSRHPHSRAQQELTEHVSALTCTN